MASDDRDELSREAEELHAKQEYEANELIIMMTLLVVALSLGRLLHRYHVRSLTEAGLFILVGLLFGLVVHTAVIGHELQEKAERKFFFNHELFNLILLPHIIFEAGFSLPRDLFFTRIGAIAAFAVGGTIIATVFTWSTIMVFVAVGAVVPLSAVEAGALSALISAIDPVSTLTLFKLLQVHPELHNLLFGESVLNDAVSIILFRAIMRFFSTQFNPARDLPATALAFMEVSAGSILMGFLIAAAAAALLKVSRLGHTDDSAIIEAGIFWAMSYLSFLLAETLELSGIVSALFCGIGMARYAAPNLSRHARVAVPVVLEVLAILAETTVFVLVGLAVWAYCNQPQVWKLIIVTTMCCFIGRALNIFGLSALLNRRASPEFLIPMSHQVVMWFSGLRGAIAVTLAVQVPGDFHDEIVMTTIVIVLFTTFVLGGLSEPLIRKMKIEMGPDVISRFHAERKRRLEEQRRSVQEGDGRLCHGDESSSDAGASAGPQGGGGGVARLRVRVEQLRRHPQFPRSVLEAASLVDEKLLKPLLVDATVEERVERLNRELRERPAGASPRIGPRADSATPGPMSPSRPTSSTRPLYVGPEASDDEDQPCQVSNAQFEVLATLPHRATRHHVDEPDEVPLRPASESALEVDPCYAAPISDSEAAERVPLAMMPSGSRAPEGIAREAAPAVNAKVQATEVSRV